jgi:tetratricopeptide (TPR) repeat protein
MVFRPAVFISSTPGELDPYREAVKATLREMGAEPVELTDREVTYGPLGGLLKMAIGPCEAVIHLCGFAYGEEPRERTHGAPRRSYAHYEYDVAMALRKPLFAFVAKAGTPVAESARVDDEARGIHYDHRRALERGGEHWSFSSVEELTQTLRALRTRILVRRRLGRLPLPQRGREFVGRERAGAEIRAALETAPLVVLGPATQTTGIAACAGKSALAIETAWKLHHEGRFDFVFALPGTARADMESALASLARSDALALVADEVASHGAQLSAVRQWLRAPEQAGRFLAIIDAVDTESSLLATHSVLPWLQAGKVIVTSRLPYAWGDAPMVSVGTLSPENATALLASRVFPTHAPSAQERAGIERAAVLLGRQPLALHLAGRAMAETRMAPDAFLASVQPSAVTVAASGRSSHWLPLFASIVRRSATQLDATARAFLNVLVCLAPDPAVIPIALFSGRPDVVQTRTALTQIERLGLIIFTDGGQEVLVHRHVREVVRDSMNPEEMSAALDSARAFIEAALPRAGRTGNASTIRDRLVPHGRVLLGQLNGHPIESRAARLAHQVAASLREAGRLRGAEYFQRRALGIVERTCAADHPDLVPEVRHLAAILHDMARFADAEALHRRAVKILEQYTATHSTELVAELYGLAASLRSGGRIHDAEAPLRRALDVEERHSGPWHPRTGIAAHTLAALLEIEHRPHHAVPLYRRALEIDERVRHVQPARLASRLHHLAIALGAIGRRWEAVAHHERALSLDEQAYGEHGIELVAPLKQLATLYALENQLGEAERLLRHALAIEHAQPGYPPLEHAATLLQLAHLLAGEERASLSRTVLELLATEPEWHPLARRLGAEAREILDTEGRKSDAG